MPILRRKIVEISQALNVLIYFNTKTGRIRALIVNHFYIKSKFL